MRCQSGAPDYWSCTRGSSSTREEGAYCSEIPPQEPYRLLASESEKELFIDYKGVTLKKSFRVDYICYGQILVELKALNRLSNIEIAQLLNYMKITEMRVGLLINFGARPKLEWKRFVI